MHTFVCLTLIHVICLSCCMFTLNKVMLKIIPSIFKIVILKFYKIKGATSGRPCAHGARGAPPLAVLVAPRLNGPGDLPSRCSL